MPPTWVIVACYFAIAAGTMLGGWRIVKTMGQRLTKLKPVGGFLPKVAAPSRCFWLRRWEFGFHHAYHHRRDCRCRCGAAIFRRTLGRSRRHRLGVDPDHSGQCRSHSPAWYLGRLLF